MNFDDLKLILVPTDFSQSSALALRAAVRLAQTFHSAIEVFHVDVDPSLVLPPPLDVVSMPQAFGRVLDETAERLDRVVAEVRAAGVSCSSAEEVGRSHAAIVAREYGIPGVVGTREATGRIANGVLVHVDGDAGEVTVLG